MGKMSKDAQGKPPPAVEQTGHPDRTKRLRAAAINKLLAEKRCGHCLTVGRWEIYNKERTRGRVVYVRCKGCGRSDRVIVAQEGGK